MEEDLRNPRVSVCMPAYNAEKYIRQALDSLLSQSYPNIEIIVVNDGSSDATQQILEQEYQNRGIIVINQKNKGQCAAANAAYHASSGELIKFMDADDLISPLFIEKQVEKVGDRRDVIASAGWGRFYNDDLSTFKLNVENVWRDLTPIEWLVASLERRANMMQCALWLIPRKILEVSGLWDERLSLINDFEFFIRVLLQAHEIKFTQDAILFYRSGYGGSLSSTKSEKSLRSAYLSTKLGIEYLIKFEDSPRIRSIAADCFQLLMYQFYPSSNELFTLAADQVKKYGGSRFPFPSGGVTKILSKLVGWKLTTKLKLFFSN